uniref:NAC domain-containing protein n=1 Tax=Leersia perrieri TaxID=77586 RepID=A0A0D9XYT3_9ORYZ
MASNLDLLLEAGYRFSPSPQEVVTFYIPRLFANITDPYIHIADVYAAEPKDLARDFAPVASSSNGDRWFFTQCKRVKGKVSRAAGGGTWVSQSSKDIKNREGKKIGETKNFRFKKGANKENTDWLMEEYHLVGGKQAGDVEPVVCRIYVSPRAAPDSAAHQESAALPPRPQELAPPLAPAPAMITKQQQQAAPLKRPAVSASVAETLPCSKKMRRPVSAKRVMAPPPPLPMPTYLIDPFKQPPQPLPQENSNQKLMMDAAPFLDKSGAERDDDVDDFAEIEQQIFSYGEEIAGRVALAPTVKQTIAPNDDEPHEFCDEDMDELMKLMDDKIEEAADAGNGTEGDDMGEFARFLEDGLLSNDDKSLDQFEKEFLKVFH